MLRKAQARPKSRELRKLYRGLRAISIIQRIEVLKTALQWFDQAMEYISRGRRELTAEELKSEDKMMKARRLGMSTNFQPEKETAFYRAIQIAEELCMK